ncbi:MAG: response regulator [Chloroflexi bacterium]|nr:response regulator [Chloroflexota bacterium]
MSAPQGDVVLVVEDDDTLREVIKWALEDEGARVAVAADGQQALEWVATHRPALIVLDVGLPIVGGDGVAAGVRAIHGDTVPILVVTADGRAAEKARKVGAFAYLHKPFDLDRLVHIVQHQMGQS